MSQANEPQEKDLKLFSIFSGLFCVVLATTVVINSKIFALGPFNLPGGVLLFPISFIFNDILTEVYGYARSRRVVWTGLASYLLITAMIFIVGLLPPAPFWQNQEAYELLLGVAPRLALAGLLAYFCGEFANSFVLSKMKYKEGKKRNAKQSWRFVASTIVGEGVDTVVFMVAAFWGVIPAPAFVESVVILYAIKVAYEIVALPFSTRLANWVKKVEGIDHIDTPENTQYNPFAGIFGRNSK